MTSTLERNPCLVRAGNIEKPLPQIFWKNFQGTNWRQASGRDTAAEILPLMQHTQACASKQGRAHTRTHIHKSARKQGFLKVWPLQEGRLAGPRLPNLPGLESRGPAQSLPGLSLYLSRVNPLITQREMHPSAEPWGGCWCEPPLPRRPSFEGGRDQEELR